MNEEWEELRRRLALLESRMAALEAQPSSKKVKPTGDDARFDAFWAAYPKKVNKGQARVAWSKMTASAQGLAVEKAADYGAIYEHATEAQLKFVPNPATWLNASGWEDDPKVWRANFAAYFPNMSRKPALPPVGKSEAPAMTQAQREALAKAQEERAKADRAELVARLKKEGKLPKGYTEEAGAE